MKGIIYVRDLDFMVTGMVQGGADKNFKQISIIEFWSNKPLKTFVRNFNIGVDANADTLWAIAEMLFLNFAYMLNITLLV